MHKIFKLHEILRLKLLKRIEKDWLSDCSLEMAASMVLTTILEVKWTQINSSQPGVIGSCGSNVSDLSINSTQYDVITLELDEWIQTKEMPNCWWFPYQLRSLNAWSEFNDKVIRME